MFAKPPRKAPLGHSTPNFQLSSTEATATTASPARSKRRGSEAVAAARRVESISLFNPCGAMAKAIGKIRHEYWKWIL